MQNVNYDQLKDIIFYARKVITVPSGNEDNGMLAMTALKNLSDYGFVIDREGLDKLKTASKEDITDWYYKTADVLNEMAGGNHEYHPFYPNFPEQVIEMSELELFIDQITHYFTVAIGDIVGDSNLTWTPGGENEKAKIKSLEEHPLKVIPTVGENDKAAIYDMAKDVFRNTLKSKLTPSAGDTKNIINAYMQANSQWTKEATTIENRQVLSYLYTKAVVDKLDTKAMPSLVTNDYMRIAQNYSWMKENNATEIQDFNDVNEKEANGGVKQGRVSSLPNAMRKFIANGLEGQKNLEEDIARNKEQWKAVFRIIHVGTMPYFTRLNDVAFKLRNNEPLSTFYSRIDKLYAEGKYSEAVDLYATRPGEFIKNLNKMLTVNAGENQEAVKEYAKHLVEKSKDVFAKTRPEDLIRLVTYLNSRTREDRLPVHNVKGVLVQTDKVNTPLPQKTADVFIALAKDGIAEQIKTGKSYGKVYIDPKLAKAPLPTEVTDSAGAMNAYPRGTRLAIEQNENGEPKNFRAFIWWTNIEKTSTEEFLKNHPDFAKEVAERVKRYPDYDVEEAIEDYLRVDLDLSVNYFKKDPDAPGRTNYQGAVAYHSGYKLEGSAIVHSGDVTNGGLAGGAGVTEYIDCNIQKCRELGIDYIQLYVNSFTGQKFGEIPCLGGWQEREELDKSMQFDIKAVKQTSELSKNSAGVNTAIIDVQAGEIIWVDAPNLSARRASNSINAINNMDLMLERYARGDQMSMLEMAELAVKTNGGEIVDNIEEADTVFSLDEVENVTEGQRVITAKNQDIWLGEFMSPQTIEEESIELETDAETDVTEENETEEVVTEEDSFTVADAIAEEFTEDVEL